jgi:lipid-binding SYLF domain-containing protein
MLLALVVPSARAGNPEVKVVESATEVVKELGAIPLRGIPHELVQDAAGVAVIPHVIKLGLVLDARFGRGVLLRHEPNGRWSNPAFVSLKGGGVGGQAGVESTDLVLVFKTKKSFKRAVQGKLALGEDVTVAAGPIGRDAEAATDRRLHLADIYSYSRSRGLFVGLSLEGARLHVDARANKAFYGVHEGHVDEVFAHRVETAASLEALRAALIHLSQSHPKPELVVPIPGSIGVAIPLKEHQKLHPNHEER